MTIVGFTLLSLS